MSITTSRAFFAAELLVVAFPISIILILYMAFDLANQESLRDTIAATTVFLPSCTCLYFGWCLSVKFLIGGTTSLRQGRKYAWWFATVGVLLAVLGCISYVFPWQKFVYVPEDGFSPRPIPELRGLALALPLLIPYAHLVLERAMRGESNNRLERSRGTSSVSQGGDR